MKVNVKNTKKEVKKVTFKSAILQKEINSIRVNNNFIVPVYNSLIKKSKSDIDGKMYNNTLTKFYGSFECLNKKVFNPINLIATCDNNDLLNALFKKGQFTGKQVNTAVENYVYSVGNLEAIEIKRGAIFEIFKAVKNDGFVKFEQLEKFIETIQLDVLTVENQSDLIKIIVTMPSLFLADLKGFVKALSQSITKKQKENGITSVKRLLESKGYTFNELKSLSNRYPETTIKEAKKLQKQGIQKAKRKQKELDKINEQAERLKAEISQGLTA